MLQLIAEVAFLILGIIQLATGKTGLAKMAGVFYILPLPFTFFVMVPMIVSKVQANPRADVIALTVMDFGFMGTCFLIGGVMAKSGAPRAVTFSREMRWPSREWASTKDGTKFMAEFVREDADTILVRRNVDGRLVKMQKAHLGPEDSQYLEGVRAWFEQQRMQSQGPAMRV